MQYPKAHLRSIAGLFLILSLTIEPASAAPALAKYFDLGLWF